ncbi:hypothetical protein NTD84_29290 [Pseudomonas sp. 14P_8.1_Bac3]|uniref:NEL-type E3 ubiquitin ligase domain-containing protein n=1 Tax=Pseudomonas sp. 14P_8.1_Bac3 TaxID=2971621 RepID=UPI0021C7D0AD|nr:NEL-type E3 ubiquitin ligase domain-containing protein [Pseudomonas sp. 14P_8.1_Bac3]MCU1763795.1 hypothetical protein [Pseudomonas sp. 14P_8.1_Bac3]
MPDSITPVTLPEGAFNADLRGVHYDFLKNRIPSWFTQASKQRQHELGNHELQLPSWYRNATPEQKKALADSHARYRETLNTIDARLGLIKDVFEFAEQPLKDAIQARFRQYVDVRNIQFFRKYGRKSRDDLYGFFVFEQTLDPRLTTEYRGTSLLEAALANFEPDEEKPLPCNDCQIITRWRTEHDEVMPSFEMLEADAWPMETQEFAKLCRTLDLGAKYQQHIKEIVQPEDESERKALEQALEEHLRQQLAVAIEIGHQQLAIGANGGIEAGIGGGVYRMLQQALANSGSATLDGRPVTYSALTIFGIELVGPLLIGPTRKNADRVERLAVYLPNDPQQPIKEYATSGDFMADLRTRLHSAAYRRYFSQFVPLRQQGIFITQLSELYNTKNVGIQWDYPLGAKPVNLPMGEVPIEGDLWTQLRQNTINKIYNNARAVAVPTEDEDSQARLERLQSYYDAANSVFNLAAFVVPVLGPVMLTVGAAQMCDEVFEGIEAYERGDTKEMWAHFSGVALNAAFVGTGAAVLPKIQVSSVVDSLKQVTLADGKQKLWKPDLSQYKTTVTLPPDAVPDELGTYSHEGKKVLPLGGDHYLIEPDATGEHYRIKHPTRAGAYSPELAHNGEGAWHHEAERPHTWEGATLMRRLGPVADGFSDAELEQARRASGVDDDVLRRVHANGEPVPAILLEALKKFRAHGEAVKVATGIDQSPYSVYAAPLAVELPGWPAHKAIEAFSQDRLSGPSTKYGNLEASPQNTLKVTLSDVMSGRLLERLIAFLSEDDIKALFPTYTPVTPEQRIAALRDRLQEQAIKARARITESRYTERQPPVDQAVAVVQGQFKSLPASMIQELLSDATSAELTRLNNEKRVPLRIAEGARRLQQQVRLTRAAEGLSLEAMANKDTEVLALNTLPALPGWVNDLRIEIREGDLEGELRASVGPDNASERKVLVRRGDGRYEARTDRDEHLHGIDDLFSSLQHALPDRHRQAIGLPDVSQGAQLKAKIIEHQLGSDRLRPLLKMRPRNNPFFKAPMRLSGDRMGYPLSDHPDVSQWRQIVEERIRTLYRTISREEMDEFIASMEGQEETILRQLELEFKQLKHTLQTWYRAPLEGATEEERQSPEFIGKREARREIGRALLQAWRREGRVDRDYTGEPQGQVIKLADLDLHGQLDELPPLSANFNHVTSLNLSNTGIPGYADAFLENFSGLRKLNLSDNELAELPESLGRMVHMTELDLSGNLLKLDAQAVARLRGLTRLKFLALDDNPLLELPPDISQMPSLETVLLAQTGINTWPVGVFDQPRPRTFYLDLQANHLQVIPEVEPGSAQAEIVARTVISHEPDSISAQNLQRVRDYRQSVRFEPDRPYPARGILDSGLWKEGLTEEQWLAKQDTWADLEREPGSEPFFREIRKLSQSADARSGSAEARIELCDKVWQMVEAAHANTALRETLFRMATAPTTCVDANSLLFNSMGVEVLTKRAYELGAHELIETELIELARGKWRLDELGRIAAERVDELLAEGRQFLEFNHNGNLIPHFDAQGNQINDIDQVEIHMIYPTQLATRLDLPWQSRHMMFGVPEVTAQMVNDAYARVRSKEQGSLLQTQLIEQGFWVDFIRRAYSTEFKAWRIKGERLLDLQTAQQQWLAADSAVMKIHWRAEITRLAKLLGKADSEVKPGTVLSNDEYYAQMADLGEQEKTFIAKTTADAIRRAGLQRVEAEGVAHNQA